MHIQTHAHTCTAPNTHTRRSAREHVPEPAHPHTFSIFAAEMNQRIHLVVFPMRKHNNNNNNLKYHNADKQAPVLRPHHFLLPTPMGGGLNSVIFISGSQLMPQVVPVASTFRRKKMFFSLKQRYYVLIEYRTPLILLA